MSGDTSRVIRRRLIFSGRVQGVGFRATTCSIARRHPVVGYVKNLPDGTVELVAEGEADVLDRLLEEIESAFGGGIRDVQVSTAKDDESFERFDIRY